MKCGFSCFKMKRGFILKHFFWPFIQWLKNIFISILLYNSRIQNPAVFFSVCGKAFVLIVHVRTLIIKVYHSNRKNMNYLILTETEFFGLINGNDETINLNAAYGCFVKAVVELLSDNDTDGVKIALAYAENELEYHNTQYLAGGVKSHTDLFVRKALSFVRKMQKQISTSRLQVPPLSPSYPSPPSAAHSVPTLKWTGNAIDLVEMIYGISEMGCINDGEIPLKELAPVLYSFFGVNSKDCYRFYTDIKRRKNDSRTYFLDRMQKKLNEKMQRDDELERMRR